MDGYIKIVQYNIKMYLPHFDASLLAMFYVMWTKLIPYTREAGLVDAGTVHDSEHTHTALLWKEWAGGVAFL